MLLHPNRYLVSQPNFQHCSFEVILGTGPKEIMPSLLLVVLLVEVAVHLVNTIGATTINDMVRWTTSKYVVVPVS